LRILTILKIILRVYTMQFYGKNNINTKYTYYFDWCLELLTYYIMSVTIIILILNACIIDLAFGGGCCSKKIAWYLETPTGGLIT